MKMGRPRKYPSNYKSILQHLSPEDRHLVKLLSDYKQIPQTRLLAELINQYAKENEMEFKELLSIHSDHI